MIRINLLPAEVQGGGAEFKLNPSYAIGGVAALMVVVLIPFSGIQISRRKHLNEDVAVVQEDLKRFTPIVAQVELLEQSKAQLEQRKTIIQSLENERLRYPYFMEDFLKLLPANVWLANMTTTTSADNQSLTVGMDIVALDHYAVADMVSNLETSQIFSDIDVGQITLNAGGTGTGQTITFHVNSVYRKVALNAPNANAPKKS